MTYFRNKFNKEFLFLCENQKPKGGKVKIYQNDGFWVMKKKGYNQTQRIEVIPLLLFNKIMSSNKNDKNIEDYVMFCQPKSTTTITCIYDELYFTKQEDKKFVCELGINNITGDLSGE